MLGWGPGIQSEHPGWGPGIPSVHAGVGLGNTKCTCWGGAREYEVYMFGTNDYICICKTEIPEQRTLISN